MSVELIVGVVVVLVVLGFAAYKLGWFTKAETALKADVSKAVDDLKAHVTATVAPAPALTGDHVAQIVTAQGNALAAAVAAVAKPAPAAPASPFDSMFRRSSDLQAKVDARDAANREVNGPPTSRPDVWAAGSHIDFTFSDAVPLSVAKTVLPGTYELGCGAGQLSDSTPEIPGYVKGYGAKFTVAAEVQVTVTITPNKVPCQVSVGLMNA